jgi:dihydrodipicolinate synthase/N-acetylneuraminate lyase
VKDLLTLRGIVTVLNTPFTDDDAVDLASLRRNIGRALEAGVAGFLIPALASEVYKLSARERDAMVEAALDEAGTRAMVIGGASAPTRPERVAQARRLVAQGCPGILAMVPYQSDAQYLEEVEALAELGPGFLMLQDWDFAGPGLPIPLIVRLFESVPAFRALKIEVAPAGPKYSAMLEATQGRLHVSGGWAVQQMLEALDRGVHAFMPTGMHFIYTRIYRLYAAGDRAGAEQLFHRILPVLAFANQHLDISIHFFKLLLHRQGIYATPRVRDPILPFDPYHRRNAEALLARAMDLEYELIAHS